MQNLSQTSIQYVKGVGPARKKLFEQLGVETIEDLFYFFPRRYEDRRNLISIAQLKVGEVQAVSGTILAHESRRSWYAKKHVSEIVIDDQTGRLVCVWFNQPYLERYFEAGKRVVCFGKVDIYKNRLQMISPEYEVIANQEDESLSLSRIVPVYPLTRGITQRYLRKTIKSCLDNYQEQLHDELPVNLRNQYRLPNIKRSIGNLHFPEDFKDQEMAMRRISFEEFFFFQISVILRRLSVVAKKGITHSVSDTSALNFINSFPFSLTSAQKKAITEIRQDMSKSYPMLRLLQGDVGSGKTVVALFGVAAAYSNGYQSAIMAPTEILARQHYDKILAFKEKGPLKNLRIAFLSSSLKADEKVKLCEQIKNGDVDLVVGTHALIDQQVNFKNLSFVVIDEQHKFGVRQRALLSEKGSNPDILIMTATPIPRTLCITLYGDLDISILDQMPPGRGKVKTVLYSPEKALEVYQLIRKKIKEEAQQVYIIYPLIEESDKVDLKAAESMFKHFQKNEFKDLRLALIHGQLKKDEAHKIMEQFKNKKIDVLVATTVVEVGVDVPDANVMVIEHAERFGLSQLHQLRGRIGRGTQDALCILIAEPQTEESKQRLKAILSTTDGFKIAQQDLLIRGPGSFFGRHQHGLNELKFANPVTQLDILELARQEALKITQQDPKLEKSEQKSIKNVIKKRYPTYLAMVEAG